MSAVCGILNLDGRPLERAHLGAMQGVMAEEGRDRTAAWLAGPVGIGQVFAHDADAPPSFRMPLQRTGGKVVIAAVARLDNRDELRRKLAVVGSERAAVPDSCLILAAYEKWGTQCPDQLLGDFSFAVWDEGKRRLFLARDHCGVSSMYFYHGPRTFTFASSLPGLFANPEVPRRLNRALLAGSGYIPQDRAATDYDGISRLTPACAVTVETGALRSWRYWDLDDEPEIRLASDNQYVEAFTEIYREAVRCRLRDDRPVATMLSGGLDSGSIAVLAARELGAQGRRLSAFTSVPRFDTEITDLPGRRGDETSRSRTICDAAGNIDQTLIDGASRTPVGALEEAFRIHGRQSGTANYIWNLEILETARNDGFGVILDGWGGNRTVSWAGDRRRYWSELLRTRRWRTYAREINDWRIYGEHPLWRTAATAMGSVLPGDWDRQLLLHSRANHSPLTPAVRRHLRSRSGTMAVDEASIDVRHPGLALFLSGGGGTATYAELGAAFGIEIRLPANDKRLLTFCARIPLDQYTRGGRNKWLIRRAMSGSIPHDVLWDKRRGLQSADIGQRIRADKERTAAALATIKQSDLAQEYLDFHRLQQSFDTICARLDGNTFRNSLTLMNGLRVGLFLSSLDHD